MTDPVEPDNKTERNSSNEAESIAQSVTEVIDAFFGVGASIAKTFAEATANNKKVSPPNPDAAPLNVIIHYSLTTVSNVINMFADGIGNSVPPITSVGGKAGDRDAGKPVTEAVTTAGGANSNAQRGYNSPVVQRGGTLRIPLSIENPGNEIMQQLTFLCLDMRCVNPGPGVPLDTSAIRFQPVTLTIEPRDFEKLTAYIDTGYDTSPGEYEALLGLGNNSFEILVKFEVLSQTI